MRKIGLILEDLLLFYELKDTESFFFIDEAGGATKQVSEFSVKNIFFIIYLLNSACAAANFATGTLKGEQET